MFCGLPQFLRRIGTGTGHAEVHKKILGLCHHLGAWPVTGLNLMWHRSLAQALSEALKQANNEQASEIWSHRALLSVHISCTQKSVQYSMYGHVCANLCEQFLGHRSWSLWAASPPRFPFLLSNDEPAPFRRSAPWLGGLPFALRSQGGLEDELELPP